MKPTLCRMVLYRSKIDNYTVDLVVFGLGKTYREYAVSNGKGRGQWDWPPRA